MKHKMEKISDSARLYYNKLAPSYHDHSNCPPSAYAKLAKQGLTLIETLVFLDMPLWNGLPQCGGVFALSKPRV